MPAVTVAPKKVELSFSCPVEPCTSFPAPLTNPLARNLPPHQPPRAQPTDYEASRITIFDTTLRDGEQTPGVTLNLDEKLILASKLSALGVDVCEAGFPIASRVRRHFPLMHPCDRLRRLSPQPLEGGMFFLLWHSLRCS